MVGYLGRLHVEEMIDNSWLLPSFSHDETFTPYRVQGVKYILAFARFPSLVLLESMQPTCETLVSKCHRVKHKEACSATPFPNTHTHTHTQRSVARPVMPKRWWFAYSLPRRICTFAHRLSIRKPLRLVRTRCCERKGTIELAKDKNRFM